MFQNLQVDSSIQEEKDSLGGSRLFESGIYDLTIKLAFLSVSDSGAMALNVHAETEDGQLFRTQQWMTSGTAKGGHNYYVDGKGNKQYLPGFNVANAIALMTTGKNIAELATEEKTVNLYNATVSKEVPTPVQMFTDLLGTQFAAGIIKQTVNKNVKGTDGKYVAAAETRDENELDKVFQFKTLRTTVEIKAGDAEGTFAKQWAEKYSGVTRSKVKEVKGGPKAGAPAGASATPSLFV
jgi:hypothetical protein